MKKTLSFVLTLIMVLAIMAPMTILSYADEAREDTVTKSYYVCSKEVCKSIFSGKKSSYSIVNTYDKNGNLTKTVKTSKDADGASKDICQYKFDSKERITKLTTSFDYGYGTPSKGVETYTYDSNGNVTKKKYTEADGEFESTTTYTYNSDGLLIKTADSSSDVGYTSKTTTTYSYDSNGNIIKKTEKYDDTTFTLSYTYDSKGNVIKEVEYEKYNDGSYSKVIKTYTYDKKGNQTKTSYSSKDGDRYSYSNTYVYTYNDKGVLTKENFNENDNGIKNSFVTTYTYDSKGNLKKTKSVSKKKGDDYKYTEVYSYDSKNRLVEKVETLSSDGSLIVNSYNYTYDSKNRIVKGEKKYIDGDVTNAETYSYTYDKNGNEIKYVYYFTDVFGDNGGFTTTKAYDKNGNLTKETTKYHDGDTAYDTYNYIKSDKVSYYFEETDITCTYKDKYTYTGKAITPTVLVRNYETYLLKGADYRLIYKNNKNPGKAKIIVDFIDNDNDDITLTFTIAPKKVTGLKAAGVSKTAAKLSWDKAAGAKYYEVEQSTDGKKWTAAATVSDTKATVKSLKAGTKYQFRVKALDSSKKVAGKASTVLKVTTKKK